MADLHEESPVEGDDGDEDLKASTSSKVHNKHREPGIIYLSRIPEFMSVKKIKQIFEHYGELGRVFLQPDDKAAGSKKGRLFTEGWVEYQDKGIAKRVALSLNNTMIGGKRHSKWHDQLWNIKYLHRFKWTHLNERLAYEKAVHQQRLRTEIAQVKRETNFHIQNMEKSQRLKKKTLKERKAKEKEGKSPDAELTDNLSQTMFDRPFEIKQRETEDEILSRKRKAGKLNQTSKSETSSAKKPNIKITDKQAGKKSFLKRIFSGGLAADET